MTKSIIFITLIIAFFSLAQTLKLARTLIHRKTYYLFDKGYEYSHLDVKIKLLSVKENELSCKE